MKNRPFLFLLICIGAGIAVGSVFGLLGLMKIIDGDTVVSANTVLFRISIGAIAAIADTLVIWALVIKPNIDKRIMSKGISTTAIIEDIRAITHPGQLEEDKRSQKARFVYKIRYHADNREISLELPPTCLTSESELEKVIPVRKGEKISVKYLKAIKSCCLIDNELLFAAAKEERKASLIHMIMIPIIFNIVCITLMIII